MKSTLILTFLALFVAIVAAQSATSPFYITSPLQGDSFKAGSTVSIRWNNGVDGAAKINLLTGTDPATMKPTGVTISIKGEDGEYDWKVPSSLPQGATFSFQISYTDPTTKEPATVYSAPFTLSNTTGTSVTQSFTSASAVPSSAVSSAISSAVSSAVSVTSVIPSSSKAVPSASVSPSASATPAPNAAAGFKAPTVAICVIAMIASAFFL